MRNIIICSLIVVTLILSGCSGQDVSEKVKDARSKAIMDFQFNNTLWTPVEEYFSAEELAMRKDNERKMLLMEKIKADISDQDMGNWEYINTDVKYSYLDSASFDIIAEKEVTFKNLKESKTKYLFEIYYYDSDSATWNPLKSTVASVDENADRNIDEKLQLKVNSIWKCDYDYICNNCKD